MSLAQCGVHKQLRCPICLDTFESPKALTCLHIFCEKCICKHVGSLREDWKQTGNIECPLCRCHTAAPGTDQNLDDWAAKLPVTSIVSSILASGQINNDNPVNCEPCLKLGRNNISVAYCVTCSEYLCHICCDCHKTFKATKDHSLTVQSMHQNQSLTEKGDRLYRCLKHLKKYTFYCQEHADFCCSRCAFTEHNSCKDLILIENVLTRFKESSEAQHVQENLNILRKLFLTLIENRSKCLESIQQQKTDMIKTIKEWTCAIKDLTDKLEASALEDLEQVCKQEIVIISDQSVECKSAVAAVEISESILLEETKSNNDTKLFITTTRMSQQVKKYVYKYEAAIQAFRDIQIEFKRDKKFEGLVTTFTTFGQVTSKASEISELSSNMSFERAMILRPRARLDSMLTFNAKVPDDEKPCKICSGVCLPDEQILVSDQENKKLKLFRKCSHCLSYMNMEYVPRFLCIVDNQTVAVTTGSCKICIVSVNNKLAMLRTINVMCDCYGITSYQQNLIVIIQEKNGNSLITYDKLFNKVKRISVPDNMLSFFNTLCVSPDGHTVYYTGGNTIIAVDMDGMKINTFESNDLQQAFGITVDNHGNIYCCGNKSQTVIQITPEGRQLDVLLSSGHALKHPTGICLNAKNNAILVFEGNSDEFKLYGLV